MKTPLIKLSFHAIIICALLLTVGCSTMPVTQVAQRSPQSCEYRAEKDGLEIGVHLVLSKQEAEEIFIADPHAKGVLPILLVAKNNSASSSFVLDKKALQVLSTTPGGVTSAPAHEVRSATGQAMASAVSPIWGGKLISDAGMIQHNLGDKEFYTRTLSPGAITQGFIYYQYPKDQPLAGTYRLVFDVRDPASGNTLSFDIPMQLNR